MVPEEIEALVKWYLLNNNYELNMSNPVNRSPAVMSIREIAESVSMILKKCGSACTINEILRKYAQIKQ